MLMHGAHMQGDLRIIRRAPAHGAEKPETPSEGLPAPPHVSGLKKLSYMLKSRASPLEAPDSPKEHAFAAAAPQEASPSKAIGLRGFRRQLSRLTSGQHMKSAEAQDNGDSYAAQSQGHASKQGHAQRSSDGDIRQHVPPKAHDSAASHSTPRADFNKPQKNDTKLPEAPRPSSFSTERPTTSSENDSSRRTKEGELGEKRGSEGSSRRRERQAMHPMLAAIHQLADAATEGDGQAARQKLASILSICKAGLAGMP